MGHHGLLACLPFAQFGPVMPLLLLLGQVGITSLFDCSAENILTTGVNLLPSELLQPLKQFASILVDQVVNFGDPEILKVGQRRWSD